MTRLSWLVPLALVAGCGVDPDDDTLGDTQQAVSSVSVQSLTCSLAHCTLDLHLTSADHACFLGGISGKLSSSSYSYLNSVTVEPDNNGEMFLQIDSVAADTMWAEAVCVPVNPATVHILWWGTGGVPTNAILAGGTAARRCFLTRVAGVHTFGVSGDYVQLTRAASGTWTLDGQIHNPDGQTFADATCFDVGADLLDDGWTQASGATTLNLLGTHFGRGGVPTACGLSAVAGVYTTNDIANGQQLWRNSDWNWSLTGPVGGAVDCFE